MKNVVFQGVVRFRAGAKGSKITGGGGLGFDILSADDITIENCMWNGQHRRDQNFIWDDPAGDFPSNITIRGCTFQGYCCAGAHEEALYVGSSVGGLIENCTFTDNATQNGTGHIFFTYCGQKSGNHNGCASNDLGTEAKNWCVRGCTFGPGPKYYSVQVHEFVPASANIKIDPSPVDGEGADRADPVAGEHVREAVLTLTKLAETSSTITLGWTAPATVDAYVFYAKGVMVSFAGRTNKDGTARTSVKFSKTGIAVRRGRGLPQPVRARGRHLPGHAAATDAATADPAGAADRYALARPGRVPDAQEHRLRVRCHHRPAG